MSNHHEVAKDILLKAIDSGYIPKVAIHHDRDALDKNLESIKKAYKEIFEVVNNPTD